MTTGRFAVSPPAAAALRGAAPAALAGLLGLAVWAVLFRAEIAAALHVWYESTAYSHCYFVLPIAGWLAWDRRAAALVLRPRPVLWPALAVLPCGLAWFAAERLGIMEGRQLAAMGMALTLALALLGWRLAWEFSSALLYTMFLVPFGSFLVPDLQRITTWFVETGLAVMDIPHVVDAFVIEVPGATFFVAEACAGLRFLIAAVAFGVLYAGLTYRSPWRRLAFIAASCTVPIAANGLRALGIVVAGYWLGSAEAAAADHIIYGWGFFSAVILLMTLAGLPFREDLTPLSAPLAPPLPPRGPDSGPDSGADSGAGLARALASAAAVLLLAVLAPAAVPLLDHAEAPPALALPGFAATGACLSLGDGAAPADGRIVQHFSCGGVALTASVQVLSARATPAALRAARAAATGETDAADAETSTLTLAQGPARSWRLVEMHEPDRLSASAAWVRGAPDPGGLAGRAQMAWDSVAGGAQPPVLVGLALRNLELIHGDQREAAKALLRDFLAGQGALLAAVSGGAA